MGDWAVAVQKEQPPPRDVNGHNITELICSLDFHHVNPAKPCKTMQNLHSRHLEGSLLIIQLNLVAPALGRCRTENVALLYQAPGDRAASWTSLSLNLGHPVPQRRALVEGGSGVCVRVHPWASTLRSCTESAPRSMRPSHRPRRGRHRLFLAAGIPDCVHRRNRTRFCVLLRSPEPELLCDRSPIRGRSSPPSPDSDDCDPKRNLSGTGMFGVVDFRGQCNANVGLISRPFQGQQGQEG